MYNLEPLHSILLDVLREVSPATTFKTLQLDKWGSSPWYPLLALQALEESALPVFKGRKKVLKELKSSRQKREWIIGNYYWALWKWCMKEIHDDGFNFVPISCAVSLKRVLLTPCLEVQVKGSTKDTEQALGAKGRMTDGAYK